MTSHSQLAIEVFDLPPVDFAPTVHVSACYVEREGKILLLLNAGHKYEAGKWGVPAGKLEKEELPLAAAVRELFEETGIEANPHRQVKNLGSIYIRKPDLDYVYHLFAIHLDDFPQVFLSDEHDQYVWARWEDLPKMTLMLGGGEALEAYRRKIKLLA